MLYWVLYLENEENKIVFIPIVITKKMINLWLDFRGKYRRSDVSGKIEIYKGEVMRKK